MKNKIISMILMLILLISIFQNYIYATTSKDFIKTNNIVIATKKDKKEDKDQLKDKDQIKDQLIDKDKSEAKGFDWNSKKEELMTNDGDEEILNPINDIAGTAITITQVIAIGVAIIMLMVLAMKYMLSAPEDKASIKKHAVVYVVGAIVMFASTGILEIIRKLSMALED